MDHGNSYMSGSLDETETTTIHIRVNETSYALPRACMDQIHLVRTILENDPQETTLTIALPSMIHNPTRAITQIVEYVLYHHENGPAGPIEKPLRSEHLRDSGVSLWDDMFISKTDEELTDLASASNYLDIPFLLALCCAKIGSFMKSIMNQYPDKEVQQQEVRKRWIGQ